MSIKQLSIPLKPEKSKLNIPENHSIRNLVTSEVVGKTEYESKRFIVLRELGFQSPDIFCRTVFFKGDTHSLQIASLFINRTDGQYTITLPNNVSQPADLELILTLELEEKA